MEWWASHTFSYRKTNCVIIFLSFNLKDLDRISPLKYPQLNPGLIVSSFKLIR